jgi:hypothetical protein
MRKPVAFEGVPGAWDGEGGRITLALIIGEGFYRVDLEEK